MADNLAIQKPNLLWSIAAVIVIALAITDAVQDKDDSDDDLVIALDDEGVQVTGALDRVVSSLTDSYAAGTLTEAEIRSTIGEERVGVNLEIFVQTANERTVWFGFVKDLIRTVSFAGLFLLLGPLWIRREAKRQGKPVPAGMFPFFLVTTAAVLFVVNAVGGLVVDLQRIEVGIATAGAPRVAITDATLHYIAYANDRDMQALVALLIEARHNFAADPLGSAGMLEHLLVGFQAANESVLLGGTVRLLQNTSWILTLYAPLLALMAVALVVQVAWPIAQGASVYPSRVLAGEAETMGQFAWSQLKVIWREFRTVLWCLTVALLLLLGLVALMRAFCGLAVVAALKALLAATAMLESGAHLPDWALFITMVSLTVFLVSGMLALFLVASQVLKLSFLTVRSLYQSKRSVITYKPLWAMIGRAVLRVFGGTLLAAVLAGAVYVSLLTAIRDPSIRVWLAAPVIAPAFLVFAWRLRVIREIVRTVRLTEKDVCSPPSSADHPA